MGGLDYYRYRYEQIIIVSQKVSMIGTYLTQSSSILQITTTRMASKFFHITYKPSNLGVQTYVRFLI